MKQGLLLVYSVISREEIIFQLRVQRIISSIQNTTISVQKLQNTVQVGENVRRDLEDPLIQNLDQLLTNKQMKKICRKMRRSKFFYAGKLKSYFPDFMEATNNKPNLYHNPVYGLVLMQREELRQQILITGLGQSRINPRNERFFNALCGLQGIEYLNRLHVQYFFTEKTHERSKKSPYCILGGAEENKKYGFKHYISSLESGGESKQGFLPTECTQEIVMFRYSSMQQEMMERNVLVMKSIKKFIDDTKRVAHLNQPLKRISLLQDIKTRNDLMKCDNRRMFVRTPQPSISKSLNMLAQRNEPLPFTLHNFINEQRPFFEGKEGFSKFQTDPQKTPQSTVVVNSLFLDKPQFKRPIHLYKELPPQICFQSEGAKMIRSQTPNIKIPSVTICFTRVPIIKIMEETKLQFEQMKKCHQEQRRFRIQHCSTHLNSYDNSNKTRLNIENIRIKNKK